MNSKLAVFLFAAGEGKRLRPYTQHTAKPLLAINPKDTLLSLWLQKLNSAELPLQVFINAARHYQGFSNYLDKVRGNYPNLEITLIHEQSGPFETAGGLYHFAKLYPKLEATRMLLISSDIYSDCPIQALFDHADFQEYHRDSGKNTSHLFYVENPEHHPQGDFCLGSELASSSKNLRTLESSPTNHKPSVCYSGVAWIDFSSFLAYALQLPSDQRQNGKIAEFFCYLISQQAITASKLPGSWQDVGRVEDLLALRAKFDFLEEGI